MVRKSYHFVSELSTGVKMLIFLNCNEHVFDRYSGLYLISRWLQCPCLVTNMPLVATAPCIWFQPPLIGDSSPRVQSHCPCNEHAFDRYSALFMISTPPYLVTSVLEAPTGIGVKMLIFSYYKFNRRFYSIKRLTFWLKSKIVVKVLIFYNYNLTGTIFLNLFAFIVLKDLNSVSTLPCWTSILIEQFF